MDGGLSSPSAYAPLKVLLVEDEPTMRSILEAALQRSGHAVLTAGNASRALDLFQQEKPDLVLTDVQMPGGHDGYWLARAIRQAEAGGWTPIIFLSAQREPQNVWEGIESGGDDYLIKPVMAVVLEAKLRAMQRLLAMRRRLTQLSDELREANARLEHLSAHDALTGLMNRRALDERLRKEIGRARREGQPISVLLCDLDHFKQYNDRLGHLQGDACLRKVGEVFTQSCLRPTDFAARYGGEEFALVLPNTSRSGALSFARVLLRQLETVALPHPESVTPFVTLSGGITTCVPDEETTPEGMLMRADDALYSAKASGKNRFFSYEMRADTREPSDALRNQAA